MSSIKLISQSLSVVCHVDLFNACNTQLSVDGSHQAFLPYHGHADDHLIYGSCRDRKTNSFRFVRLQRWVPKIKKLRTHLPKFCTLEYVNKSLLFIESKD